MSDACNEKGIRVSFFDQATQMYRHVLLVWPYVNSKDHISFDALHAREGTCTSGVTASCAAQQGIHAGGMVWYGNYLYVADTANGMRVFDLRKIMDLNPDNDADVNDPTPDGLVSDVLDKKRVGRQSNVWYSYGYRYVMPQVATLKFTTAKNGGSTKGNQCYSTGRPKASYISLDRTDTDHLVLGEYCNHNNGGDSTGRVGTYPMTALTAAVEGAAGTTASADLAYGLPHGHRLQRRGPVAQDPGRHALRGHVVLPPQQRVQQRAAPPGHPADGGRYAAARREHEGPAVLDRAGGLLPRARPGRRLRPAALLPRRARPDHHVSRVQA